MKRKMIATLLATTLCLGATPAFANGGTIVVQIDGVAQTYDQPPAIVNGSTMVPLRGIFEALGASVQVTGNDIEAVRGETTVRLTIGSDTATVNGQQVKLSQKSVVMNGRTLVPLRFVSEALGASVHFDPATLVVSIATSQTADVVVTIPADLIIPGTGEQIMEESELEIDGDVVQNADGSITFTISGESYAEYMEASKNDLLSYLEELINGGGTESFHTITYDEQFTEFTVHVDPETYENSEDVYATVGLGFAGMYYQLFAGVPADRLSVSISIVDMETGALLDSVLYPDDMWETDETAQE